MNNTIKNPAKVENLINFYNKGGKSELVNPITPKKSIEFKPTTEAKDFILNRSNNSAERVRAAAKLTIDELRSIFSSPETNSGYQALSNEEEKLAYAKDLSGILVGIFDENDRNKSHQFSTPNLRAEAKELNKAWVAEMLKLMMPKKAGTADQTAIVSPSPVQKKPAQSGNLITAQNYLIFSFTLLLSVLAFLLVNEMGARI